MRAVEDPLESPVVLSALPVAVADKVEPALARQGHLVSSNASALRTRPDVPLVVPEVNAPSLSLLASQPWAKAGGAIVTNPNCVVGAGWEGGMGISVGRVRSVECHDLALTVLVHNLVRGAAGACLANAELAVRWLGRHTVGEPVQILHP